MNIRRLDGKDAFPAGRGDATGLFHDEAHRVGLIEKAQTAALRLDLFIQRIGEKTTPHEHAIDLGDHGGQPTHIEVLFTTPCRSRNALIDVTANRFFPETVVRHVDRKFLGIFRNSNVRMGQNKFTDVPVKRKSIDPLTCGQNQDRGRTVDTESGGDLGRALLHEVFRGNFLFAFRCLED